MAEWNQARITQWAVDTFGEPTDLCDIIDRADEEMAEACWASRDAKQGLTDWSPVVDELADVYIVMCQVCEHLGQSLQSAVDRKMEKNSKRKWVKTGEGVGQHT